MHIHTLLNPNTAAQTSPPAGEIRQHLLQTACVLAIGNFDGVHLGHQVLLRQLQAQATQLNALSVVMIFQPQPLEYLHIPSNNHRPSNNHSRSQAQSNKSSTPIRLMSARDKVQTLFEFGIGAVLLCRFDQALVQLQPDHFMSSLRQYLNLKGMVLGQDFRFGYQRSGDITYLKNYGQQHGISIHTMPDVTDKKIRISSSIIRRHICNMAFAQAQLLLGRPYLLTGIIKHGLKLARGLGFHTANLHMNPDNPPIYGVFVGRAYLPYNTPGALKQHWYKAVANAGYKPTIAGQRHWQLEVHIFDETFKDGTLSEAALSAQQITPLSKATGNKAELSQQHQSHYGQRLAFEPLAQLRNEQRFTSIDELKRAILQDLDQAHAFFNTQT